MTDQLLQYYSDRNRARMGDAAERTFITHDGITVDPPPPPADIEMLSWIPTESTTPSGDQATLEGPEVEEQDLLSEFGDFAGTVFRTIGDLPAAAIRGLLRGGVENARSLGLLDEEQAKFFRRAMDASYQEAVEEGVEPITASIVEGVAQIAPAALPVFAALRYAGVARTGAMLIAEAVGGAFSVNPDDPNLGNMAQEFIEPTPGGELATALDLLATDPDDPDWQNRARNGIQDSMLGLAFEGLMRAPGVARKMVERWKSGKSPVPPGIDVDFGDDILAVDDDILAVEKMVERWKSGKSPVPAGMSIEDVGDDILAVNKGKPTSSETAPSAAPIETAKVWQPALGDVVTGDTIRLTESVFGGSYRKPRYRGSRTIEAEVIRDSYGADKQQHTFTLRVISSSGVDALETGKTIRRKGRNVYRGDPERLQWADESERKLAVAEKHERGDTARAERDERRANVNYDDGGSK